MDFLNQIIEFFKNFNFLQFIGIAVLVVNALIGVFMLIPGEQPEKFLQGVVDFLKKFSR